MLELGQAIDRHLSMACRSIGAKGAGGFRLSSQGSKACIARPSFRVRHANPGVPRARSIHSLALAVDAARFSDALSSVVRQLRRGQEGIARRTRIYIYRGIRSLPFLFNREPTLRIPFGRRHRRSANAFLQGGGVRGGYGGES